METRDADSGIGGLVRFFLHGSDRFRVSNERCSNSKCSADLLVAKRFEDAEGATKFALEVVARDGAGVAKRSNEAKTLLTINYQPDTSGLDEYGECYQSRTSAI